MKGLHIFADNVFAHEILHFCSGIILFFLILKLFFRLDMAIIAFLLSVLIDIDHYLEGFMVEKAKIGWIFKHHPCVYWKKTGRMTIFFHSWELLPIIWFLGKIFENAALSLSFILSLSLHYSIDTLIYGSLRKISLWQYFFIFRLKNKFSF